MNSPIKYKFSFLFKKKLPIIQDVDKRLLFKNLYNLKNGEKEYYNHSYNVKIYNDEFTIVNKSKKMYTPVLLSAYIDHSNGISLISGVNVWWGRRITFSPIYIYTLVFIRQNGATWFSIFIISSVLFLGLGLIIRTLALWVKRYYQLLKILTSEEL